ncbi:MAG: hypothetical protein R3E97_19385 [Candidatus Eisenbacteria bacterium]
MVDREVLRIDESVVDPAPVDVTSGKRQYIAGIGKLEGRLDHPPGRLETPRSARTGIDRRGAGQRGLIRPQNRRAATSLDPSISAGRG